MIRCFRVLAAASVADGEAVSDLKKAYRWSTYILSDY